MSHIPGFESAQRAWEAMLPPDDIEECEDGDCDQCEPCLADRAAAEAEDYADMQWEERRLESRYGA